MTVPPTTLGVKVSGSYLKDIGRDISYSFVVSVSRPKLKQHQTFTDKLLKECMAKGIDHWQKQMSARVHGT